MPLRITTWNVNGIRNPFSYKPWSENRSFAAMFDALEADIVCLQETKIQRKDLQDDMVMVPGWDSYFTFPVHKRGYSGVAVYTRQSKCAPLRVEEGITGILCPPKSTKCYLDLPSDSTIGGYPELNREDARILDSEGRALVVDFGLFVLIGTYSPANRDEARDEFRIAFVETLMERIRNLVQIQKRRVVVVGDLNISRDVLDMAGAEKGHAQATTSRRLLNALCAPEEEGGVMVDLCREFWPDRKGMYTHWEQKINARPGNYGSRIDYVLCSKDMRTWFTSSNIQEGLMGSDHCPVFATLSDEITFEDGTTHSVVDLVNPPGTFIQGVRQSTKMCAVAALSARLYPEFAGRRSIKDMFGKPRSGGANVAGKSSCGREDGGAGGEGNSEGDVDGGGGAVRDIVAVVGETLAASTTTAPSLSISSTSALPPPNSALPPSSSLPPTSQPRSVSPLSDPSKTSKPTISSPSSTRPVKRQRTLEISSAGSSTKLSTRGGGKPATSSQQTGASIGGGGGGGGQRALTTFFQKKNTTTTSISESSEPSTSNISNAKSSSQATATPSASPRKALPPPSPSSSVKAGGNSDTSRAAWSSLFTKRPPPKCDGHGEPCIQLTTKKPGPNFGRAFWICPRPVGPQGEGKDAKRGEKNGEWRCGYFLWSSEWNGSKD